jgi:hypothetical protein
MLERNILYFILICIMILSCNKSNYLTEIISVEDWNMETKLFIKNNCECDLRIQALFIDRMIELGIRDSLIKQEVVKKILLKNKHINILEKSSIGSNLYTGYIWSTKSDLYYVYFDIDSLKFEITKREENPNELFSSSTGCITDKNACDFYQSATIHTELKLGTSNTVKYDIKKVSQRGWVP